MTQLHTVQSAFTFAFNALRERGFTRAGIERILRGEARFKCRYRGAHGMACAIGLFIPEENYSPALEDYGPLEVMAQCPLLANLYNPAGIEFMERLQAAHDTGHTPEVMETNLRDLASRYSLEVPA